MAGGSEPTRKIMLRNWGQNTPMRMTMMAAQRYVGMMITRKGVKTTEGMGAKTLAMG